MLPGNIAMASGLALGFSIGLGAMGVLALGQVVDAVGLYGYLICCRFCR